MRMIWKFKKNRDSSIMAIAHVFTSGPGTDKWWFFLPQPSSHLDCVFRKLDFDQAMMAELAHFVPWLPIGLHYFWPPMLSSWISAMFKWINPCPQNALPIILNELQQISFILRRLRKYNCKKGGVECEFSRRERDFPNTFGPPIFS